MQHYENYIIDALELVMSWNLPEAELAGALNDQVRLMSGMSPDEIRESPTD